MKYLGVPAVVLSLTAWLWYARRRSISALEAQSPMREDIHDRLMRLSLYTWCYNHSTTRHLGAMAQDWKAAFPMLGKRDTIIPIVDAFGVLMAAVQWQGGLMKGQEQRIQQLQDRMEALQRQRIEE